MLLAVDKGNKIRSRYDKYLSRIKLNNLKPEVPKIKPAAQIEQGQRILANIIASAYLRKANRESHTESHPDCKVKGKEVQR
jgi:hypothetical protein